MNIQDKIVQLESEQKALGEKINELKEEVKKQEINGNVWKPKKGEQYHFLTDDGWIDRDFWEGCCEESDRVKIGNIFKTEEDVKFMIERLRVIHELKEFARPLKRDGENYYIYYSFFDNCVNISHVEFCMIDLLCFDSKEIAEKAIESVGEERIKKYYLQMED